MSKNPYLVGLLDMAQQRFSANDASEPNSVWLCKNTKLRGRPFSFDRYPFQVALVDDPHQNSVTVKPSQVGVSEIYQRLALALLRRNPHRKLIYAYPDDMMRQKNVQTRVHPIAEQPIFNPEGQSKPIRSIDLVQIVDSFLYMTGSKVGDATSTDADAVFLDEYDLHNMANAVLFRSRMQNSDWKTSRIFSTPTWALYGVDGEYQASDQTQYEVRCDACNTWQFPMFTPEYIKIPGMNSDFNDLLEIDQAKAEHYGLDIENSYVCCRKCGNALDLGRSDNRHWATRFPSRTNSLRGWKVNPFSTSVRPPKDIFRELWVYLRNSNLKGFKNSVLGEPEDTGANRLQEADIRACLGSRDTPFVDKSIATWIGIDMGHQCHVFVGQGSSIKNVKVVRAFKTPIKQLEEEISGVLATYNVIGGACDRHPESLAAERLREMSGGRIIPCEYRGQKEIALVKSPETGEITHAQINRTQILDSAAKQIRQKDIEFNGYGPLDAEIVTNYRNMIRDENPEKEAMWVKLDNNDHFFHAGAFLNAAIRLKEFQEAVEGVPQTTVVIAGMDSRGYNSSLLGNQTVNPKWQQRTSSLY